MDTLDKIEPALDKFDRIMKLAEERIGKIRNIRYQRIVENQNRFIELQRQNDQLIQQTKAQTPTVKISAP